MYNNIENVCAREYSVLKINKYVYVLYLYTYIQIPYNTFLTNVAIYSQT